MKKFILPIFINKAPNKSHTLTNIKDIIYIQRVSKTQYRLAYESGHYFEFWTLLFDFSSGFTKRQVQWLFKDLSKHPKRCQLIEDQYNFARGLSAIKVVDYKFYKKLYNILMNGHYITFEKELLGKIFSKYMRSTNLHDIIDQLQFKKKTLSDRNMREAIDTDQPFELAKAESKAVPEFDSIKAQLIKDVKLVKSQGLLK